MMQIEEEMGYVIFSIINAARLYGLHPENALERTNKKFITRFNHMEQRAAEEGKKFEDMTLTEMESYWQEAKSLK